MVKGTTPGLKYIELNFDKVPNPCNHEGFEGK